MSGTEAPTTSPSWGQAPTHNYPPTAAPPRSSNFGDASDPYAGSSPVHHSAEIDSIRAQQRHIEELQHQMQQMQLPHQCQANAVPSAPRVTVESQHEQMAVLMQMAQLQQQHSPQQHTSSAPPQPQEAAHDGWELPTGPALSKRQQKKLRRQQQAEATLQKNGAVSAAPIAVPAAVVPVPLGVGVSGVPMSKRQQKKHRRQQQLAAEAAKNGDVQIPVVKAPPVLSEFQQRKSEFQRQQQFSKTDTAQCNTHNGAAGAPQSLSGGVVEGADGPVPLSKRQQKKLARKQAMDELKAARRDLSGGAAPSSSKTLPKGLPTEMPDEITIDAQPGGRDIAALSNAMRLPLIIGGIVCVATAIIICTVFGIVGLFDMKPFPFAALGPVAVMVIGVGLLGLMRHSRLVIDRRAGTVTRERSFFFFPCCPAVDTYDLQTFNGCAATLSSVKINNQRMMNVVVSFGKEDVEVDMSPIWGSDAVRLKWYRYFEWAKADAAVSVRSS